MYTYMCVNVRNVNVGACVEVVLSSLYRLLNHAHLANVQIAGLDKLLEEELKWLLKVRVCIYVRVYVYELHKCTMRGLGSDGAK